MTTKQPHEVCYLDMDGVLVDFVGGSLRYHGKHLAPADVRWEFPTQVGFSGTWASEFWDKLGFDFWANLEWTHEGKDLLYAIEEKFGDNVILMTSPCATAGSVEGKISWINSNLPKYARKFMVGPAKHLTAGPGKLLVDDYEGNTDKFVEHGGRAVLVPRPWNRRIGETDSLGRFNLARLSSEL